MRYLARVVSVLLVVLATFPLSYATPLYPVAPPPGEATGGVFDTYFTNMYTAPCAIGQVIQ